MTSHEFFPQLGESSRYTLMEIMGKGSYGVVCSATDNNTGEKVAIKKITDVFEHVSDATRILREIKLLRYLKHADIVQIKHIMLPSSPTDFKEVYVVFELMESDLHQVHARALTASLESLFNLLDVFFLKANLENSTTT